MAYDQICAYMTSANLYSALTKAKQPINSFKIKMIIGLRMHHVYPKKLNAAKTKTFVCQNIQEIFSSEIG